MYFLYFCSFWHFLVKPPHLCMKPKHTEKRCLTATFDNSFIFVSSIKDLAFILESVVLLKKCYIHFTHRLTVASFRGTTGNKKSTCHVFTCNVGVRQGEILSPFLFSLYINDLKDYLLDKNITGLSTITEGIEKELFLYLKMFILFYADDTVILAESANDLQFALNEFYRYCDTWKLTVNICKTKIVVFSKGRQPK